MNKENEYLVISSFNPHSAQDKNYWVVHRNEAKKAFLYDEKFDGIGFKYMSDAHRVCKYLNTKLEQKVDEKLYKMFHRGEIKTPFNFLDAWNDKCEETIVKRFDGFTNRDEVFIVKCHFDSDLLVLSNVPNGLDEIKVCRLLDIPYEPNFGANTFLSEDMILNVSKVRERMNK